MEWSHGSKNVGVSRTGSPKTGVITEAGQDEDGGKVVGKLQREIAGDSKIEKMPSSVGRYGRWKITTHRLQNGITKEAVNETCERKVNDMN